MENLNITTTTEGILVKGNTYDVKELLKAKGGRWNAHANGWMFAFAFALRTEDELREALREGVEYAALEKKRAHKMELAERKKHREWLRTQEGMEYAAAEEKARVVAAVAAGSPWICCTECEVIDWKRKHTSCRAHAVDGNTFRLRGNIYTGD